MLVFLCENVDDYFYQTAGNMFLPHLTTVMRASFRNRISNYSVYNKQDRGDSSSYNSYLNAMDASMKDKIATVASFIPISGRVADMGTGSGLGSYHISCLYPSLDVTGVDINSTMIKHAEKKYKQPNLHFQVGDIAERCLNDKQNAIINCSVLHHVTSFNGYDYSRIKDSLINQKSQLVDNGLIVVRDFISPGDQDVLLDIPAESEDIEYFFRFTKEFRKLHTQTGIEYEELPGNLNMRQFRLSHRLANEFILRKDYKQDWNLEIQEEYTYGTLNDLRKTFEENVGLRLLSALHIRNSWIINNRYKGKVFIRDLKGEEIDYPATNCIIVGQKVKPGEGISLEKKVDADPQNYLKMTNYQQKDTKQVLDLVKRPGRTIDIVPFFKQNQKFFVVTRMHYPRPILGCTDDSPSIDGSLSTTYATEPLNVQQDSESLEQAIDTTLNKNSSLHIKNIFQGIRIFPSPGGVEEEIISKLVEIDPIQTNIPISDCSGFTTSGSLCAIEAQHLLRASQVGALRDARLELNVYKLLHNNDVTLEAWIGEKIFLDEGHPVETDDVFNIEPRVVFSVTNQSAQFLKLQNSIFIEKDSEQKQVAEKSLEYVVPQTYSINTVSVAILHKYNGQVFIGIDDDDRPAIQSFDGHSNLIVAPAWRLPKSIKSLKNVKTWIIEQIERDYRLKCHNMWHLGSSYHPTAGVTPEIVFPLAVDVSNIDHSLSKIKWVPLDTLIKDRDRVLDGHLHILMLRAAHALL